MGRRPPSGAVRKKLEVLHEELTKASAPNTRDNKTVERCIKEIQEILGLSSSALSRELGVSDQTVLRWRKHPTGYERSVPSEIALSRLHTLIGVGTDFTGLPDELPATYFRAVADSQRPSISHLRLLVEHEKLLGIELNEETCRALIRNVEGTDK